jgi:hypothetical protein
MPASARAQATRTWVSGVGDDANPCSRTAPCKTFAGAISKTAAGGEISVLDPGGFGALTITKSISITSPPGYGSVLHALTNGININGAGVVVQLRGLVIEGANTGLIGINFIAGASLHLEECVIRNSKGGTGVGILFAPASGQSDLVITNSTISNNGSGTVGGGILVKPTGSGVAFVTMDNVRMVSNTFGYKGDASATSGSVLATIKNSIASHNGFSGVTAIAGSGSSLVMVEGSISASNGTTGLRADGNNAVVGVSNSTISLNGIAVQFQNGAQMLTGGSNTLFGNASNGGFSGSLPPS